VRRPVGEVAVDRGESPLGDGPARWKARLLALMLGSGGQHKVSWYEDANY